MDIPEIADYLIVGLQFFPLTEKERAAIYIALKKDEQKLMFIEYMETHPKASPQELKNELGRILKLTLGK